MQKRKIDFGHDFFFLFFFLIFFFYFGKFSHIFVYFPTFCRTTLICWLRDFIGPPVAHFRTAIGIAFVYKRLVIMSNSRKKMAQEEKKRRVQAIFSSSPEDSGAKAENVRNVSSKRTAKREKADKKRGSGKRRPYDPMPMDVDWPKYLSPYSGPVFRIPLTAFSQIYQTSTKIVTSGNFFVLINRA